MIELLREKGVVECEFEGTRLVLGPLVVLDTILENSSEVASSGKPGKDGLTKQEQIDLYGRVVDAE